MATTIFDQVMFIFSELEDMEMEDLIARGAPELVEEEPNDDEIAAEHELDSRTHHLYEERSKKALEIVEFIAGAHGHSDLSEVDYRTLIDLVQEAKQAIENWAEADIDVPHPSADTPFRKLLNEHHKLGEAILDVDDEIRQGRYRRRRM